MNQERNYTTKHDKPTDTRTANIGNVASGPQIVGRYWAVLTRFLARLAISLWTEGKEQTMCHRIRTAM